MQPYEVAMLSSLFPIHQRDHEPCRFCGGRNLETVGFDEWWEPQGWHVVCDDCGACGPSADDEDGAWKLWDRPQSDR